MHLRISKLLLAFVLASLAVLLMSSLVMAAPSTANVVNKGPSPFQSPIMTPTVPFTHPVALAISSFFGISYTEVISMHDSGLGFGVIARVYLTALAADTTPEEVLALFQSGMGWGQIAKELGVHPGGKGLGAIMSSDKGNKGNKPECQGNSCNAPGQQNNPSKPGNSGNSGNANKPNKPVKPEVTKGPKK